MIISSDDIDGMHRADGRVSDLNRHFRLLILCYYSFDVRRITIKRGAYSLLLSNIASYDATATLL